MRWLLFLLINLILELKQRNPEYGCPKIALLLSNRFGIEMNKSVRLDGNTLIRLSSEIQWIWKESWIISRIIITNTGFIQPWKVILPASVVVKSSENYSILIAILGDYIVLDYFKRLS